MALVEDLTGYFGDFGQSITLGGVAVTGIFDDAYADALGMAGSGPVLTVKSASATAVTPGTTTAIVGAVTYTVIRIEPDGTGLTRLVLQE